MLGEVALDRVAHRRAPRRRPTSPRDRPRSGGVRRPRPSLDDRRFDRRTHEPIGPSFATAKPRLGPARPPPRAAQAASTRFWPGNAISGSSSGANQRSSATSSAGDRLAVAADEPGDREDMPAAVRLDVDAQQLDRLDLEPRLLPELAAQPVGRALRLVQEAAGEVPEATPRLASAAGEQHAAVALEDPLHARDRVRPVLLAAVRTDADDPRPGRDRRRSEDRTASRRARPSGT